jgi:hypothetical protein
MANRYTYNGFPFIQCGTFTTNGNSTARNVTFPTPFNAQFFNVCVVATATGFTNYFMVTAYVFSITNTGFSVNATFKDGRNGQDGGGYWNGSFNYIAFAPTTGLGYTGYLFPYNNVEGYEIVSSSQFSSPSTAGVKTFIGISCAAPNIFMVASPTGDNSYFLVAYSLYAGATSTASLVGTFKDGRAGQDGGGYYQGNGNFIAIAPNNQTSKFTSGGFPIMQGGTFTISNGTATVNFDTSFGNGTIYVVAIASQNNTVNMVTISVDNISVTGFTAVAYFKISTAGQRGGGVYNGPCNYIAIRII